MSFAGFAEKRFVNSDCEIHYWHRAGTSKEFVVLLHGAGCDHLMFERQIAAFDDTYNILAWDARGHGLSRLRGDKRFAFADMYSDCLKLLELHNACGAVFVGQSMGGNLAQEIAHRRPELARKCVLIDCTVNAQKLTALEKFSLKISAPILRLYPNQALVRQSANACGVTAYTKQYALNCFNGIAKDDFVAVITSVFTCLREDAAFRFPQPMLLLCGEKDAAGNIRKAMRTLAERDRNCILRVIQSAGHNANQDNPGEVNKHIRAFLKG